MAWQFMENTMFSHIFFSYFFFKWEQHLLLLFFIQITLSSESVESAFHASVKENKLWFEIKCVSFIFSSTWVWPFLKHSLTSTELCAVSQQPVDGGEPREMGRSTTGKHRFFSLNEDLHCHPICNYFSSDARRYNNSPKSVELTS